MTVRSHHGDDYKQCQYQVKRIHASLVVVSPVSEILFLFCTAVVAVVVVAVVVIAVVVFVSLIKLPLRVFNVRGVPFATPQLFFAK